MQWRYIKGGKMKQGNFIKCYYGLSFIHDCLVAKKAYPALRELIYCYLIKYATPFISNARIKKISDTYTKSIWNDARVKELNDNELKYLLSDVAAMTKAYMEAIPMLRNNSLLDEIIIAGYEQVSDEEKARINDITDTFKKNKER